MKRCLTVFIALVFWLPGGLVWGQPTGSFKENLDQFIAEALQNNPELREAEHKISASKEVPPQAGSLDDPVLKFELKNLPVNTFSFSQEAMTQKQVTITQKFPFPGKLGLKTEMAKKDVEIAEENYEEIKLRIVREVKRSYYELSFIMAAIDIVKQNKELLQQFVTIAETKYSVGKGIQQDVLKAQVELSKILDELIRLNKLRENEQARLNTLMNRLPQAPLSIPHGIAKTRFSYGIDDLQRLAEQNRPFLKGIKSLIERFDRSYQLARKQYYPDFNIGFRYGQRQNSLSARHPDFVSGFIGINIPIWFKTKQARKAAEERHKLDMAREKYNSARNQVFLK
ncbi:MAG: TolC family protein, partial [Nitrospinales bacterium]